MKKTHADSRLLRMGRGNPLLLPLQSVDRFLFSHEEMDAVSDAPTKYCQDCGATINARAEICPHCGVRQNSGQISRGHSVDPSVREAGGNKLAAGICAILIGSLGVHKFILGYSTSGLIMLLVSLLTCGIGAIPMGVIGIVEGIIYLTKSDEEFYETYVLQKKEWF